MGTWSGNREHGGTGDEIALTTGEIVEVPLSTVASLVGAVLPAERGAVAERLPDGLAPVRLGQDRAAVGVLAVAYDRIGDDAMEPYDEFAVVFPAVETRSGGPLGGLLTRGIGGYVWYMPVTTEPGRALGTEVWGYPKVVADVTHDDRGRTRHTTVREDGQTVVETAIDRPQSVIPEVTGYTYSMRDGDLLRAELELRGEVGVWPAAGGVSYSLGDHPRAETLRSLGIGDEAVVRLTLDGEFVIHRGDPVRERGSRGGGDALGW